MDWLQILMTPFSWLLTWLYHTLNNYGLALAVFALIVKVIMFPMAIKGKRGMIQMNMISGRQAELQKKYANDKAKLNEELEHLYTSQGVDRTGGCLWTLLPVLILLPLYAVVRRPLRYLMGMTDADIALIKTAVESLGVTLSANYPEINIASAFHAVPGALDAAVGVVGDVGSKLFPMDFSMMGLDLSAMPQWNVFSGEYTWTWNNIGLTLIPLVSAVGGYLSSLIVQKTSQLNGQAPAKNNMTMLLMGPVMALWFGFIMPAGMGVYWIVNNVLSIGQEMISGRILKKDYEKARIAKQEQEKLAKEEEKREKEARAIRIAEEKAKGKQKRQPERKEPANTESRVGMRTYARGRAYDPDRYGGVTEYRDPDDAVEEEAPEQARKEDVQQEISQGRELTPAGVVKPTAQEADFDEEKEPVEEDIAEEKSESGEV